MVRGLLAAFASAVCYGVGSALQAKSARGAPVTRGVHPGLLLRMLGRMPFVLGLALDAVGFVAQFIALREAPVYLVQAAQAASLAVTALVALPLLHVRLRAPDWLAIAAVSAGLAMLGLSADSRETVVTGEGFRFALLGAVVLLAVLGFVVGRHFSPTRSAPLGVVAGLAFAVVALAARALTGLSPGRLVADPAAYALAVGGPVAFLFYTTGLQRGVVTVVTAATVVGETVAPAAVGVLMFGDHTRPGMAPVAVLGFVLALVGALGLARFGEVPESREPESREPESRQPESRGPESRGPESV
jgi:drug/metabolite transporter (DMT)-like permease